MGVLGKFPPAYLGIYSQGVAASGIIATVVKIISLADGQTELESANVGFLCGLCFTSLCLILFLCATRTGFFKVICMRYKMAAKIIKLIRQENQWELILITL